MSKICMPVFAVLAIATLGTADAQAQSSTPTTASAPATAPAKAVARRKDSGAAARATLDLHAPPLNHIMPSSELRYILANDDADADAADAPSEVSVKGVKTVIVPGGPGNQLQAIPWAILHPTQAWRIFTPLVEQP